MAQTRWTIRNYNAFLRDAKAKFGVSHSESRALYREMSKRLDRPAYAADIKKHPRTASNSFRQAKYPQATKGEQPSKRKPVETVASINVEVVSRGGKAVASIDEWYELYDEAEDFEPEEYVSTADTGKGKKRR